MNRKSVLDPHLDIVGVLPDKEVGQRVGVTAENVRSYRVRRNIPAQWRGEGVVSAPPTEAAARPATIPILVRKEKSTDSSGKQYKRAFSIITKDGDEYTVIGTDIIEAAKLARAHLPGIVLSGISELGPAL